MHWHFFDNYLTTYYWNYYLYIIKIKGKYFCSGDDDFDIKELDALLDEGLQKGAKEQRAPKRQRREEYPEGAEMERHVLSPELQERVIILINNF